MDKLLTFSFLLRRELNSGLLHCYIPSFFQKFETRSHKLLRCPGLTFLSPCLSFPECTSGFSRTQSRSSVLPATGHYLRTSHKALPLKGPGHLLPPPPMPPMQELLGTKILQTYRHRQPLWSCFLICNLWMTVMHFQRIAERWNKMFIRQYSLTHTLPRSLLNVRFTV